MANWYIDTEKEDNGIYIAYITSNCDQHPENPQFVTFIESLWPTAYGATSDEAADALEDLIADEFETMMKRMPKARPAPKPVRNPTSENRKEF